MIATPIIRSRGDRLLRCSCHSRWSCSVSGSATCSARLPLSASPPWPPRSPSAQPSSSVSLQASDGASASPTSACRGSIATAVSPSSHSSSGLLSTASVSSASSSTDDSCSRRIAWRSCGVITRCCPSEAGGAVSSTCKVHGAHAARQPRRLPSVGRGSITAGTFHRGRRGVRPDWRGSPPARPARAPRPRSGCRRGRRCRGSRGRCGP